MSQSATPNLYDQPAKKPNDPLAAPARALDTSGLEEAYYRLYREFFARAERKRRWSVDDDIPWHLANKDMPASVADVVESFCSVELYLPDYIAKALPLARASRGRAWFHANWGYEESKHSLALGDWLLHSGHRTEQQMGDLEAMLFQHEWNLPTDSALGMVVYGMAQELATFLHYRNLKLKLAEFGGCAALEKVLTFISVDERAHHDFYKRIVQLNLERDREETLTVMRRVLLDFNMPAVYMLTQTANRRNEVKELGIFDENIYYSDVLKPLLETLGVDRKEMRRKERREFVAGNGTGGR
jgi:acyl-[acyl-carrier-protein] desaturase